MTWTARVRTPALQLLDPIEVTELTMVEAYPQPATLVMEGLLDEMRPALQPGWGVLVYDAEGNRRFNGLTTMIKRLGNKTAELGFTSDLIWLWWRAVYPNHLAAWAAQTSDKATFTGTAEQRILDLVNRNAGPAALAARRIGLTVPPSLGRGASGTTTSVITDKVGPLVAALAEAASLRVDVVQNYTGGTPRLDLTVTSVPDLRSTARIGTAYDGGPIILGDDWFYQLGVEESTVTAALASAGGSGAARVFREKTASSDQNPFGFRIESVVDMAGTTDTGEIDDGLASALSEGAPGTQLSLPIGESDLRFGSDIPLGSMVRAFLDGQLVDNRIREITTVVSGSADSATETVTAVMGVPDGGASGTDAALLKNMLKRVQKLEAR